MELAIPLLALGGLYVVSNHKKTDEEMLQDVDINSGSAKFNEGYTNLEKKKSYLQKPINYPQEVENGNRNNVNYYPNPANIMDRYFDKQKMDNHVDNNNLTMGAHNVHNDSIDTNSSVSQQYSLTGEEIDVNNFEHGNMVPFFGGKVRGSVGDERGATSILDTKQGNGSQFMSKNEIASMFKPEENMQWSHGTPNMNNFYHERVNPSLRHANTKPWEEVQVAPGMSNGYSSKGEGGFNAGMNHRDKWLPKTVDDLRVETNPKKTFSLSAHEGPMKSAVNNLSVQGRVEKHAPDTFYINTPDRWFTTTGIEKKQTNRSEIIAKDENRPDTTREYFGNGSSGKSREASYAVSEYEDPKRQELCTNPAINLTATSRNNRGQNDHNIDGYKILPNNRSTGTNHEHLGIVSGTVKAMITPIMDVLRPSRKQNVIGSARPTGDAGSIVPKSYVYNPSDRAPTTIRETTENSIGHLNVEGQQNMPGGYISTEQQPVMNQRDTTGKEYYGTAGSSFSSNIATDVRGSEITMNSQKEGVLKGRINQGGTQIFNQTENIHIDKRDADRNQNRWWVPTNAPAAIPAVEAIGANIPSTIYKDIEQPNDRMDPSLLDAFKKNPYTQSLNSVA